MHFNITKADIIKMANKRFGTDLPLDVSVLHFSEEGLGFFDSDFSNARISLVPDDRYSHPDSLCQYTIPELLSESIAVDFNQPIYVEDYEWGDLPKSSGKVNTDAHRILMASNGWTLQIEGAHLTIEFD